MVIGGIDREETSKLKKKAEGEEANLKLMKKQKTNESIQAFSAKSSEDNTDSDTDTVDVPPRISQDYTKAGSPVSKNDNLSTFTR